MFKGVKIFVRLPRSPKMEKIKINKLRRIIYCQGNVESFNFNLIPQESVRPNKKLCGVFGKNIYFKSVLFRLKEHFFQTFLL